MVINIDAAIQALYPDLKPRIDYWIALGGAGEEYIAEWNNEHPEPTEADLEEGYKRHVASKKAQEVFVSAAKKPADTIIQEAQGDYSEISQEEMYALIMALVLWFVDVIQRLIEHTGMPYSQLDQAMLLHLSNYRTKREEVREKAEDPDTTAQDIQDIDPSI